MPRPVASGHSPVYSPAMSRFHDADWTPEAVERFWDFVSRDPARHEGYFAKRHGAALIAYAKAKTVLADPVLDLGCGPGHLVDRLLAAGHACMAQDLSEESVEQVKARHRGNPLFLDARQGGLTDLPYESESAGTAFLNVVLEHLPDEALPSVFREIRRVLATGGRLIVTVPNEEDLERKKIACPECACVFHTDQHLRSFCSRSLADLLEAHGFTPERVEPVNFHRHKPGLWQGLTRPWRLARDRNKGRKPRHLTAIARVP